MNNHSPYAQGGTGSIQNITVAEFEKRARGCKLILTDNDGVLTDTGVYYSEHGEEFKRYSIRDGMGVERLRSAGIETAIITGEQSKNLARRAEKLHISLLYLGVNEKAAHLETILTDAHVMLSEIAYIGDDANDVDIMQIIAKEGLIAAPFDALPFIREMAHYVCSATGGNGAFRDFAETILFLNSSTQ